MSKTLEKNKRALPVFSMKSILLLPKCILPLNIFEPRYIKMIEDAVNFNRNIAVIQESDGSDSDDRTFSPVGCTGRLLQCEKQDNGNFIILLEGEARFRIMKTFDNAEDYRILEPDFAEFQNDLSEESFEDELKNRIFNKFVERMNMNGHELNIEKMTPIDHLNYLMMDLKFIPEENQAILESGELNNCYETLLKLFDFYSFENSSNTIN